MMSNLRRFCVAKLPFHEAAIKMIESTWTACTGFRVATPIVSPEGCDIGTRDVLFLADGSSGEFAVCVQLEPNGPWVQVESYTVPWMKTPERVAESIFETLTLTNAGTPPMHRALEDLTLDEPPETHEACWACR